MYKQAFIDEKLWAVLTENLGNLLRKEFDERSEDDRMVIERMLILVRNILQVSVRHPCPSIQSFTTQDPNGMCLPKEPCVGCLVDYGFM